MCRVKAKLIIKMSMGVGLVDNKPHIVILLLYMPREAIWLFFDYTGAIQCRQVPARGFVERKGISQRIILNSRH